MYRGYDEYSIERLSLVLLLSPFSIPATCDYTILRRIAFDDMKRLYIMNDITIFDDFAL